MTQPYRRAFDTSFEAHEKLIHFLARKGYTRLMTAGVTIDYEDVFQDMCITYMKAANKYNPDRGTTFTTYLGRAIWNEFNEMVEHEMQYRSTAVSIEDISSATTDTSEMSGDPFDLFDGGRATPEQYCEVKQQWKMNYANSSKHARLIVKEMLHPSDGLLELLLKKKAREITVASIAQYHKMGKIELRAAKDNLNAVYGAGF